MKGRTRSSWQKYMTLQGYSYRHDVLCSRRTWRLADCFMRSRATPHSRPVSQYIRLWEQIVACSSRMRQRHTDARLAGGPCLEHARRGVMTSVQWDSALKSIQSSKRFKVTKSRRPARHFQWLGLPMTTIHIVRSYIGGATVHVTIDIYRWQHFADCRV